MTTHSGAARLLLELPVLRFFGDTIAECTVHSGSVSVKVAV